MLVIKRDGRAVQFDQEKIYAAIKKAFDHIGSENDPNGVADEVALHVVKADNDITVEEIQDLIEEALINRNLIAESKEFIRYRNERTNIREGKSTLMRTIDELTNSAGSETQRENANINALTTSGTMLKYGSEIAKEYNLRHLIKPEIAKLHREGAIHLHDLDYYGVSLNCLQIPLAKLLKHGFATGHGTLRQPQSIGSAAALAAIILQSNQNEMFGGQAFPTFDWDLAPYVAKSFIDNLVQCLEMKEMTDCETYDLEYFEPSADEIQELKNSLWNLYTKENRLIDLDTEIMDICSCPRSIIIEARRLTERETFQAMEAFCHNMNTMQSRAGSQTVFSSINYGMCTYPEARLIVQSLLKTTIKGLGHSETQIFPIQIFKCKQGINMNPGEPNYDLFKLAIECSAKRLFPNFNNQDAPYNLQYWDPNRPETEIATMGCAADWETISFADGEQEYNNLPIGKAFFILQSKFGTAIVNGKSEYVELKGIKIKDKHGFVECKGILRNKDIDNFFTVSTKERDLVLTADHPLKVDKNGKLNRVYVRDIAIGDSIILEDGTKEPVIMITKFPGTMDSYDVETESDTFILSGVWSHNCRTRVMGNTYDPEHEQVTGRGNFSFTTINLPHIALLARDSYRGDQAARVQDFFGRFDKMIDASIASLVDRFELIGKRHLFNFPFLMGENLYLDSEKYKADDEIKEIIKQSTLSVGFCGLAECLVALIGKHHGESAEAQELGLKIISHLRERMDAMCEETGLSWSCFASPAESTCFTFLRKDRSQFGIIQGITDHEYYTNSSHVPVYYPITSARKVDIEAPYHELCNAGHIGYIELDGDASKNLAAYEAIVKYAMAKNMTYFSINTINDRCPICGYVGVIGDECPRCGFTEDDGVSVTQLKAAGCWNTVLKCFDIVE